MAYVSKQWKDRLVEYPNRRTITHDDLTQEVVSVNRNEGTIYEAGDVLDSVNMNNLESRIAAGFNEKQNTLTAGSGITIVNDVISATGGGGGGSSTLAGLSDVAISSASDEDLLQYDATARKWKNIDPSTADMTFNTLNVSMNWLPSSTAVVPWGVISAFYKRMDDYTGTLTAGSTSISFTDQYEWLDNTKTFEVFTDVFGVNPTDITVSGHTVTVTFEAQQTDVGVKVRVSA